MQLISDLVHVDIRRSMRMIGSTIANMEIALTRLAGLGRGVLLIWLESGCGHSIFVPKPTYDELAELVVSPAGTIVRLHVEPAELKRQLGRNSRNSSQSPSEAVSSWRMACMAHVTYLLWTWS